MLGIRSLYHTPFLCYFINILYLPSLHHSSIILKYILNKTILYFKGSEKLYEIKG